MKDFFEHREQFNKKPISEEVENLSEGLRFKKRSGSKNAWLNMTASGRGPKASLSLSNAATSGLRVGWNSRSGFSASIPGTGIHWRQNKRKKADPREAERRRAAREKQKKKDIKVSNKDAKGRLSDKIDQMEYKKLEIFDKKMSELYNKIAKTWNRQVDNPWDSKDLARMKPTINSALSKSTDWSSVKSALGMIENAFSNNWWVASNIEVYDVNLPPEFFKTQKVTTTARKGGKTFTGKIKADNFDWKSTVSDLEDDLIAMGLEDGEFEVSMKAGKLQVTIHSGNAVVETIYESVLNFTSALLVCGYIAEINSLLEEVIEKDILNLSDDDVVELKAESISVLKDLSNGKVSRVVNTINKQFPLIYSNIYKQYPFLAQIPEEVITISQALYSSVVNHDRSFKDRLLGTNKSVEAEKARENLKLAVHKLNDSGNVQLAKLLSKTLQNNDTIDVHDAMIQSGAFDYNIDTAKDRIEDINKRMSQASDRTELKSLEKELDIVQKGLDSFYKNFGTTQRELESRNNKAAKQNQQVSFAIDQSKGFLKRALDNVADSIGDKVANVRQGRADKEQQKVIAQKNKESIRAIEMEIKGLEKELNDTKTLFGIDLKTRRDKVAWQAKLDNQKRIQQEIDAKKKEISDIKSGKFNSSPRSRSGPDVVPAGGVYRRVRSEQMDFFSFREKNLSEAVKDER